MCLVLCGIMIDKAVQIKTKIITKSGYNLALAQISNLNGCLQNFNYVLVHPFYQNGYHVYPTDVIMR